LSVARGAQAAEEAMLRLVVREARQVGPQAAQEGMVHQAAVETEAQAAPKRRAEMGDLEVVEVVTAKPAIR